PQVSVPTDLSNVELEDLEETVNSPSGRNASDRDPSPGENLHCSGADPVHPLLVEADRIRIVHTLAGFLELRWKTVERGHHIRIHDDRGRLRLVDGFDELDVVVDVVENAEKEDGVHLRPQLAQGLEGICRGRAVAAWGDPVSR